MNDSIRGWIKSFLLCMLASASAMGQTTSVAYHGGRIISQVKVVNVLWGPNVDIITVAQIPAATSVMVGQPYMGWLNADYNTQFAGGTNQQLLRGVNGGTYEISPYVHTGTVLLTADVLDELNVQATFFGSIPDPTPDTVYVVYFPPFYTIAQGRDFVGQLTGVTCRDNCGYHGHGTIAGVDAPIAIIPDHSLVSCGSLCRLQPSAFDSLTETASHEVIEMVTDPFPLSGWTNGVEDELADHCGNRANTLPQNAGSDPRVMVQQIWSNKNMTCMSAGIAADGGIVVTLAPGDIVTTTLRSSLASLQFGVSPISPLPGVTLTLKPVDLNSAALTVTAAPSATGNRLGQFTAFSVASTSQLKYSLDMMVELTCPAGTAVCKYTGQCVANPADAVQCPPPPPPPFDCSSCACGCASSGTSCMRPPLCGASCAKTNGICDPCLGCVH